MKYHRFWLIIIFMITIIAGWMLLPDNPGIHIGDWDRDIEIRQGLDLQGGSRVLLEPVLPEGQTDISSGEINTTRQIIERRVNSLGVSEAVVQVQGNPADTGVSRILVELPGISDRELALETIRGTGLLEFVNFSGIGVTAPTEGSCLLTDTQLANRGLDPATPTAARNPENNPTCTIDGEIIPALGTNGQAWAEGGTPYTTAMTGSVLRSASAAPSGTGTGVTAGWQVNFALSDEGSDIFYDYTSSHIGQQMAIVVDGELLSAPTIQAAISDQGVITGSFTKTEAEALATLLRYGALPVSLEVEAFDTVGPTLGEISIAKSINAGIIGVITVLVFMVTYYRAPGFAAALALILFAMINFAAYKFIPVTLTLPAITGFLISIGTAVDGNILIFERLKEELRNGRDPRTAIRLGFERAWTSIRDSNLSTIIICIILWLFGNNFGASQVQGFAFTLGLGLVINLFTAVVVTHALLILIANVLGDRLRESRWLLGV